MGSLSLSGSWRRWEIAFSRLKLVPTIVVVTIDVLIY